MSPPGEHRTRARLLAEAARIVSEAGYRGLSVRALAQAVGMSTKVVYTHFGGKKGLVSALYEDAFKELADSLRDASSCASTPLKKIEAIGRAYRLFGQGHVHLYEIMFTGAVRNLAPTEADRRSAALSLGVLADAFRDAESAGAPAVGDAYDRARQLWVHLHGVVSLELSGWITEEEAERRLRDTLDRAVDALRPQAKRPGP